MRKEGKSIDNSMKSVYAESAPKLSAGIIDEKAEKEKELDRKKETEQDVHDIKSQ